jgi:hypothetical protein
MPFEPYQWLGRIKAVEREFHAARLAFDRLSAEVRHDVTLLRESISPRDLESASNNAEATYVIRLFAEFETALRIYLPTIRNRPTPGRTRDLLDAVAAARRIGNVDLARAHEVREFRNALVHERESPTVIVPIAIARKYLCVFLSRL